MTGIDRAALADAPLEGVPEFPPALDLVAPVIGLVGLVAAGLADATGGGAGAEVLSVARVVVGAAFLGAVSDAMLLGHWYLVQPGLGRTPLHELNRSLALVWPFEVALLLVPTGMLSVLSGTIDDGYGGLLGWFWIACAVTTLALCFVTRAALKERAYSAVMAATGLLYLAILTAFGTDLVARAVLAGA
jgi:FtsH-binding integral membrane protein